MLEHIFQYWTHMEDQVFGSLLRQLSQSWKEKPQDIKKTSENFVTNLQKTESVTAPSKLEKLILDEAAMNLMQLGDQVHGGFGSAPKFPNSANLSFILRYAKLSGISKFQEFALKTLKKMAQGGIFDQLDLPVALDSLQPHQELIFRALMGQLQILFFVD